MKLVVRAPDLPLVMTRSVADLARATTAAMREATEGLKQALRADVENAGLGRRLANTWRGKTFPQLKVSLNPAAYVYSNAPKLIDAFNRGVTIRSSSGFYLAIPTEAAGTTGRSQGGRKERVTPSGWERRTGLSLRFVYRRAGPSFLVADKARFNSQGRAVRNGRRGSDDEAIVVFLLVPQVRITRRLNVDAIAREYAARVPGLIAKHWGREQWRQSANSSLQRLPPGSKQLYLPRR
jgi:hypothetical protein